MQDAALLYSVRAGPCNAYAFVYVVMSCCVALTRCSVMQDVALRGQGSRGSCCCSHSHAVHPRLTQQAAPAVTAAAAAAAPACCGAGTGAGAAWPAPLLLLLPLLPSALLLRLALLPSHPTPLLLPAAQDAPAEPLHCAPEAVCRSYLHMGQVASRRSHWDGGRVTRAVVGLLSLTHSVVWCGVVWCGVAAAAERCTKGAVNAQYTGTAAKNARRGGMQCSVPAGCSRCGTCVQRHMEDG
jgi:hypothetical protein